MTHKDEQWEKEIRKGPFALSPFTEDHKRKVLQQVEWMKKLEEGSKGDRPESRSRSSRPFRPQVKMRHTSVALEEGLLLPARVRWLLLLDCSYGSGMMDSW